jgi:polyvinyl alcohol dehydrogenase (cytochrome)
MKNHVAAGFALVAVMTLVGGCGADASPTPPPDVPTVSAAPGATPAPTPEPAVSPSAGLTTGSPAPSPASALADWPVYHRDAARSGYQPDFPAVGGPLAKKWTAKLDGAVYGQPLVVAGHVLAATENDSVYALDANTGAVLWRAHVGTPVALSTLPCGNIGPLGITGTPAYDAATDSVFAVAEVTGPHHVLFALNPADGSVRWSRNVDISGDTPITHQQRPALAVANGHVYIGFGGLDGDCGQYKGKVVGVPTNNQGATIAYRVPVRREGAVWAPSGPVIDASGNLYVSTGNGSSTTSFDGSDSVVELSPDLKLVSRFAPSNWAADNAADLDLGTTSPALVPGGWVFQVGKRGIGYVLRQGSLGGIGGQVASASVCRSFGGLAQNGNTIYVACQSGVRQVTIGSNGSIAVGWSSGVGALESPAVGGGAVWVTNANNGWLYALDAATGKTLASLSLGSVPHFASPTLWNGEVLVGTMSGVVAVAP